MSSGTAYNFIQHFFCLLVCDSQLTIFILFIIHLDYPLKLSAWCCFFAFSALVFAQSIEREVAGSIHGPDQYSGS